MIYRLRNGAEVLIRSYREDDIPALLEIQRECFPPPYPLEQLWNADQLRTHIALFPEGALCAVLDDKLIGSATAMRWRYHPDGPHTWAAITDYGYIRTHDPDGDYLYGVDIAVRPAYRGQGVARALYQARFDLVRRLGLKGFMAGARIPGYAQNAERMSVEEYVTRVVRGELQDPVLTPQLRSGMRAVQVLHDYLPDEESANAAVLIVWPNPDLPLNETLPPGREPG